MLPLCLVGLVVDCGGGDVEGMVVGPWGEAGLVAMAGGVVAGSGVKLGKRQYRIKKIVHKCMLLWKNDKTLFKTVKRKQWKWIMLSTIVRYYCQDALSTQ